MHCLSILLLAQHDALPQHCARTVLHIHAQPVRTKGFCYHTRAKFAAGVIVCMH